MRMGARPHALQVHTLEVPILIHAKHAGAWPQR